MDETHYCPRLGSRELWKPFFVAVGRHPLRVAGLFRRVFTTWLEKAPRVGQASPGPVTFAASEWLDVLYRGTAWFYLLKSLTMVPYAIYLAEHLRREGVEHVHCQWATYPATVGMLVKQWAAIPYSIAAHAYDIYMIPRMLTSKIEDAEFVVTCADFNRRNLASLCSTQAAARIHLNYHGTDLDRFTPVPREVPDGRRRVVSVGWLKEYKGFHILLDAVADLVERDYDIELHIAGDGPQRKWLEERAVSKGIQDRLVLHGFVDHVRLKEIYGGSDVFAMGSITMSSVGRQDVIPNVLAEAMACGVPVVSTRMGGIPELIEDGVDGLLVPERDVAAMADAIARILDDPDGAATRARAATAKVGRIWDRKQNLRELAEVFEYYVGDSGAEAA